MRRRYSIIALLAGIAVCFLASGVYAGTEVPDMITMKSDAYAEHTKGIVEFSHKKHSVDYAQKAPEFYENGCGACHHDENNKPLADLKAGDDVQKCIECHKKPGEVPRDIKKQWRSKRISRDKQKKMELEWHAEAIHENCRGCHRDYNRKHKTRAAPTTCTKCHPRN